RDELGHFVWLGHVRGRIDAFTSKSLSMANRSFSTSAGAPLPSTMLAPAPAKARAYARPMPLVEPVTTATLPFRIPISLFLVDLQTSDGLTARRCRCFWTRAADRGRPSCDQS